MAKKRSSINRATEPPKIDDLKLINGIGPAVEHRLHGVGIFTFAQLAALSPADIAASVADITGLTAERIIRQNWIGQARHLAAVSGSSEAHEKAVLVPYDVSPGAEKQEESAPDAAAVSASREAFIDEETSITEDPEDPHITIQESIDVHIETIENASSAPSLPAYGLTGTLSIHAMEIVGSSTFGSHRLLHYNEPFDVRLTLDLNELKIPGDTQLNYKASIYGKGQGRSGLVVGELQGRLVSTDTVSINVAGNTLPVEGIYKLAAQVIVGLPGNELKVKPGTTAVIDGGQIQVY